MEENDLVNIRMPYMGSKKRRQTKEIEPNEIPAHVMNMDRMLSIPKANTRPTSPARFNRQKFKATTKKIGSGTTSPIRAFISNRNADLPKSKPTKKKDKAVFMVAPKIEV